MKPVSEKHLDRLIDKKVYWLILNRSGQRYSKAVRALIRFNIPAWAQRVGAPVRELGY